MKIQGKYVLAGILLIVSAGLAFDSVSNFINPYVSVSEIVLNLEKYTGENIQAMGFVKVGSFVRGDGRAINFVLTDGQESINVQYIGATPQNFDEGKDVVAVGFLSEEHLEATKLLVKCPSKYEGTDPPKQTDLFYAALALAAVAVGYIVVTSFWKRG